MEFNCSTGFVDLQGWLIYLFQLIHLFIGSLQRYEIVNGVVEVEGVANEAPADKEEDKAAEGTSQNFNLLSILNHLSLNLMFDFIWKCRERSA